MIDWMLQARNTILCVDVVYPQPGDGHEPYVMDIPVFSGIVRVSRPTVSEYFCFY